jgi:drug/metabolite transporter (DMT)-like permease
MTKSAAPSSLPYVWMLCGSLAFTLMGTCAHALHETCDWQVIALARTLLALVLAAYLAYLSGTALVFWRPRVLWIRSIAGSFSLVFTFFALTRPEVPVADVLTLTNLFPIWVALLSWPLEGEPPTWQVWLSVASGFAGVVLIQQPHFAAGNLAPLSALVASFFTAVAMMGLHRLHWIDARAIVVHFSGVSCVFCLGVLLLFPRQHALLPSVEVSTGLLLLGVGVTATVGQLFLTKAFASGPPSRVSVVGLSQVVFALLLDTWCWKVPLDRGKLVGTVLILLPTAWVLLHPPSVADGAAPVHEPASEVQPSTSD